MWLNFLDVIEDQPPEILDKSSLWLQPIIVPDESQLTCLPQWTTIDPDPTTSETKWNNLLSPPQVHTGPPFDLQSMTTEEISALTTEIPILSKTKAKPAKFIETPRGKTPFQSVDLSFYLHHRFRHRFSTLDAK